MEEQLGEGPEQRVYGCDEVESLRPDASLTMSLSARYLRARQPLAPRTHPRQNPSNAAQESAPALQLHSRMQALGCSGSYIPATILDGDWPAGISSRRGIGVVFSGCRYAW